MIRAAPTEARNRAGSIPFGGAGLRFGHVQNYLLTTLDGGARVITEPLPTVRSVAIGFWIGAGSRD